MRRGSSRVHERPFGRTPPKDREDHIAERGFDSISPYTLVHKFIPMLQDANAAVDKEWEKLEKLPAWQMTNVTSKREVILEAQRVRRNSPLCHKDGHLSSQTRGVRTKVSKVQRTSRSPG